MIVFWVLFQTNLENYNNTHYDVHRSESDCVWLRENLQELCTECVVPPLLQQTTLNGEYICSPLCQLRMILQKMFKFLSVPVILYITFSI